MINKPQRMKIGKYKGKGMLCREIRLFSGSLITIINDRMLRKKRRIKYTKIIMKYNH